MKTIKTLKDLKIDVISGQIMSRVACKNEADEATETRKVIIPKAIGSDGNIDINELASEKLKTVADTKRLTKVGDIVIKLSTPYDAAIINEESAGCLVPSFCAIVRCPKNIDVNYLLAFLNSSYCKNQLKLQVAGATVTILSVGKVSNVLMPVPESDEQKRIGTDYIKTQEKLRIVKQIVELEAKRNDIVFKEMVKNYEQ